MYAIVRVGNMQYRVEKGDTLLVDRMAGEDEGSKISLEPLLYRSDEAIFDGGDLDKVKVEAAVVGHERGKKIHGLKFKPKRGYKVRYGARADLTRIEIKDIKLLTRKPAAAKADEAPETAEEKPKPAAKPKAEAKPKPAAKKPAAKKPAAKKPAAKPKKEDDDGS
jgi:large subunit ribosomal protein L21